MSGVASSGDARRSKRETVDADSDSYEEYKSDEEGRGGGEEEDTLRNGEDKVKIISVQANVRVVDDITEKDNTSKKEDGDKKKDKKKKEKRSKHATDKEGAEAVDGQERKEKKREKKSKEGKKEKKSKEHIDREITTDDVKITKPAEAERKDVTTEEVAQKEQHKTVEKLPENAVTAAATVVPDAAQENPPSLARVPEKVEAEPPTKIEVEKVEHPAASIEVTHPEAPLPVTKEEVSVVQAEVAPPSEPATSERKEDIVSLEAAPSEAAAEKSTSSEAAPVTVTEPFSEPQPTALSQPPVAESNRAELSPPSSDAVVAEPGEQEPASAKAKDAPTLTGVEKILEHARREAEARATGSTRLLMARSLVARQEKLQEQLTNMRHEFGDIDSEIRALMIDCYKNRRTFVKHH